MKGRFAQLRSRFMFLVVSMSLVVGGQTWAQTAMINNEQSILVSKLAKHVSWPEEAIQPTFVIGVYDDVEKFQYFSDAYEKKGVNGKDITVRLIKTSREAFETNILFVPSPNQRKSAKLIDKMLRESNVLLITEGIKDLTQTMIDISYKREKINFTVIDDNIEKAKIVMPELSYILGNKGGDEILTVSPTYAKENQQAANLLSLQNKIAELNSSVVKLDKQLATSDENSQKYYTALQQKTERLEKVEKSDAEKSKSLKDNNKKIQQLEAQLKTQETELSMSKQDWQVVAEEKIKEQEEAVIELTAQLEKQKNVSNSTAVKLTAITEENKNLSSFQLLFYVFLLLSLAACIVAFLMWKKAKNASLSSSSNASSESTSLLPTREKQLVRSENLAALGYIATDITYGVGLSIEELHEQLETAGDTKNASALKPVVTLLDNFNTIAADQDDTSTQSFDLIAYVNKMLSLYEVEFDQSDIAYSYSGEKSLTVKSVPSYIALILLNVVNNALKHGFDNKGNGKLTLSIDKGAKGGASMTFTDNGKGMNKKTLEQVFTPFFTTASDRGYVGAGMSNTYDLVKNKLSGDIKLDSKEGKGTTVTINLP